MSFDSEKRQDDRRNAEKGDELCPPLDRRQEEKKHQQRRQYFRVVYPLHASPQITNLSARVVDISVNAIKFEIPTHSFDSANLAINSKINMSVKFHDGQDLEISGKILRRQDGNSIFVCIFDRQIPGTLINKEQAYLLKNFPDFCRNKFTF